MSELQIRAGAYYKTRDGRRAFVAATIPPNPFTGEPALDLHVGYVMGEPDDYSWRRGGAWAGGVTEHDLVAEWREPASLDVTLFLMRDEKGRVSHATGSAGEDRVYGWSLASVIARKTVTLTEGEGIEK